MSQIRGRYSDDFKQYAVWLVTERGQPVASTARNLGISPATLRRWKRESGAVEVPAYEEPASSTAQEQETLHALEEKLAWLQELVATSLAEKAELQRAMAAQHELLDGVQKQLATIEQDGDKLLDTCRKAHDRLMALEGERRTPKMELPTLVAEPEARKAFEGKAEENGDFRVHRKRWLALGSVFAALVLLLVVVATQQVWTDGLPPLSRVEPDVRIDNARLPDPSLGTSVENADHPIPPAPPVAEKPGSEESVAVAALEVAEEISNDATSPDQVPVPANGAPPDAETQESVGVPPSPAALASGEKTAKRYGVQVGAYRESANLERTLHAMQVLGFESITTVRTGSAASLTGVVVGDFAERTEACDIECPLNEMGWETWVRAY